MKEKYMTPEAEVIRFETEDVITTSTPIEDGPNDGDILQ